jgi:hypothetical protein
MAIYEGGDGSSYEQAIKILGVDNHMLGIKAEYDYISNKHGVENKDWQFISQKLCSDDNKLYDEITFQLRRDRKTYSYLFEISEFFGKNPLAQLFPDINILDMFTEFDSSRKKKKK